LVSVSSPVANSLNDRVLGLLERVDYRCAQSAEDREAIYKLRYAAYLREDAIPPNASQTFSDSLDATDNCWIFGVHIDGRLASSIRLHVATKARPQLPALNVFSDMLLPDIEAGRTVIDPTRFVADRELSRRFPELCYVTVRLAWMASEYFSTNLLLATVRTEHQAFYRRLFGHRPLCPARHYPSLTKPISLMALDYPTRKNTVNQHHPFFRSTYFERRMLFARNEERAAVRTAA
jgi:hypothetical protein